MDDLAELLGEGELFDVESTDGGFTVSYDDLPAHEYADLVAASAAAIGAVAGVEEVIHEDREVLVVRAGGAVTPDEISAAVAGFWRTVLRQPLPWKETLKNLAAAAAPGLKAAGFRKQSLRWNRELPGGLVQVIELSRTEAEDGAYLGAVDIGLYDAETAALRHGRPRPKFVQEMDCQVRAPAGTFALVDDPTEVVALLSDEILPLLDRVRSRRAILDEAWERTLFDRIDRAILLKLDGDAAAAHRLFQELFDRMRGARAHIADVAARCGLPPLLTGSSPDRSQAEEAFLPRWLADQDEARTRFCRAFAEHGADPRALDASPRSLDEVHRRWRDLVVRAQERTDPLPTSAFSALPTSTWSRFDHAPPRDPRPTPATRQLTEDLASYLGAVLLRASSAARWELAETSYGFEPAVAGLPAGTAHVMKKSLDFLAAALAVQTPEQQRVARRYNPMSDEVKRWLEGVATPARRWPFRRG